MSTEKKQYLLTISTAVVEPKAFKIDDDEFHFLGLEHLGEDQESEVLALFSLHMRLSNELGFANNVAAGKKIAKKLRDIRVSILSILTDVPKEQLEGYNANVHTALMEMAEQQLVPNEEESEDAEGDDS